MSVLLPDEGDPAPDGIESSAAAVVSYLRAELGIEAVLERDANGHATGVVTQARGPDAGDTASEAPVVRLLDALLHALLSRERELAEARHDGERATLYAATDPLTGVRNRRHWEAVLATEAERFRRYGNPYAIIVVDLDGLKEINKHHGHIVGDERIMLTGVMLKACVRPSDTVARLGGDEFGILAVECNQEGSSALTTRVTEAFAAAGVRASLGVAGSRPGRDSAATWSAATAAMFASKATLGSLPETAGRLGSRV